MTDMVNNPPHYQLNNGMEVIDIIEAALTEEEFRGYLKGNDLKYIYREPYKGNSEQDVAKSIWYAERYKEALAKKPKAKGIAAEVEEKKAEVEGVPVSYVEFGETLTTFGGESTQRLSMQVPEREAHRIASQLMHPAYEDYQLVLTWEKK